MISSSIFPYLTAGAFFGLTAGLSPGPMLTLVISETLQHNRTEGAKIAFVPLITDIPVILVTYFVFSRLAQLTFLLGLVALLGGMYVAWLGYQTLKVKAFAIEARVPKPESFQKGIFTNILNPNPYFFWLTVGIPLAFKAYEASLAAVLVFFLSFYTLLVGSAIGVAIIAERTKTFLKSRGYLWIMRLLGIALLVFAVLFFMNGIQIFKTLA
jgi:threonine/homoserine/homoserine lactone efflux protein